MNNNNNFNLSDACWRRNELMTNISYLLGLKPSTNIQKMSTILFLSPTSKNPDKSKIIPGEKFQNLKNFWKGDRSQPETYSIVPLGPSCISSSSETNFSNFDFSRNLCRSRFILFTFRFKCLIKFIFSTRIL